MKKDLLYLQARMKKAKIPVDRSVFNADNKQSIPKLSFSMKERLDKYQIEYDRLKLQLDYPNQRTRFKVTFGPSYNLSPSNKSKLVLKIVFGVILSVLVFFATILINELTSRTLRDTWIFMNKLKIEPAVEISKKDLKNSKLLSTKALEKIGVTSFSRKDKSKKLDMAIRDIERVVLEGSKDRKALFYVIGEANNSDIFIANILNLLVLDSLKDLLYINYDYRSKNSSKGIWDFLSGKKKWTEVKLSKSEKRSYLYVPPGEVNGKLKYIKSRRREKMYQALSSADTYEMVISRGLDAEYSLENTVLQKEVDDIYLFVFLGDLDKSKVEFFDSYLDRDKLRATFVCS